MDALRYFRMGCLAYSISVLWCFAGFASNTSEGDAYFFESSKMYSYDEMTDDIKGLDAAYGDSIKVSSLASTYDGREVIAVSVGNEAASDKVLITGAIHAREYITSQLVMMQLHELLEMEAKGQSYKDVPVADMLDDTEIYFIPMLNPDGVALCQFGLDGANNKSTRQMIYTIYEMDGAVEISDYLEKWKANARGVDLNRNFNADWEEYNDGIHHPSADHFKGVKPESEAESKAVADLTREKGFSRTISYHTQGEVIYWYYKQEGELYEVSKSFADMASKETGYWLDANYQGLDSGGYKDWAIQAMGIPSLTIEVGNGSSPVDPSQLETIWEENKDICLATLYDIYTE